MFVVENYVEWCVAGKPDAYFATAKLTPLMLEI